MLTATKAVKWNLIEEDRFNAGPTTIPFCETAHVGMSMIGTSLVATVQ